MKVETCSANSKMKTMASSLAFILFLTNCCVDCSFIHIILIFLPVTDFIKPQVVFILLLVSVVV
jgi:hypothetical protein